MISSYRMIQFDALREVFINFLKMSNKQKNASIFKIIPYNDLIGSLVPCKSKVIVTQQMWKEQLEKRLKGGDLVEFPKEWLDGT